MSRMNKFLFTMPLLCSLIGYLPVKALAGRWPEFHLQRELPSMTLPSETITVAHDPVYKTRKQYRAYPVQPILHQLGLQFAGDKQNAVLVFTASDGYQAAMAYSDAFDQPGYLAFADVSANPGYWKPFTSGNKTITPAPFYLVWTRSGLDKWRYPWPYQLQTITLLPADVYYDHAAPADKSPEISAGFSLFSRYCIRCHAMNGSGGSVGPELNRPQNISDLYPEVILQGLIMNNPAYRKHSKMPVFDMILSTEDLRALIAYLKAMKYQSRKADENS